MKRILKLFLLTICVMLILSISAFTVITASTIGSALKVTDISLSDVINENISNEEYAALKDAIRQKSSELGTAAAERVISVFKYVFPSPTLNVEYTEPNPIPSAEDALKQIESAANKGLKDGLDILNDIEQQNNAILKDIIENNNKD